MQNTTIEYREGQRLRGSNPNGDAREGRFQRYFGTLGRGVVLRLDDGTEAAVLTKTVEIVDPTNSDLLVDVLADINQRAQSLTGEQADTVLMLATTLRDAIRDLT